MIIHVVRKGDTLYEIGLLYNTDYREIANYNGLIINQPLVVGQTIVIKTDEKVKPFREISVNGFAFPGIDKDVLTNAIEHLTYLSIFSYHANKDGSLKPLNDEELIRIAKDNKVVPVMVVTNIGNEGRFDSDLAHAILSDETISKSLIDNIISTMNQKGYIGVDIDFEYVYPEDKDAYISFLTKIKEQLKNNNYFLSVAVAPKYSENQKGLLYEAHDYTRIGEIADHVIIMTYEWGYAGGPPMAVAPIDNVMRVLDYAVTAIPPNKILMGVPNYGYVWSLPFVKGTLARSISNPEAVNIASEHYQSIKYNYEDQTPHFGYYDEDMNEYEVWFDDARSIKAKLELVLKYNLEGISYWTINRPFPQNYLVLDYLYKTTKLLP